MPADQSQTATREEPDPTPKKNWLSSLNRWLFRRAKDETRKNPARMPPAIVAKAARFGTLKVNDVMVPRADIVAVKEEVNLAELLNAFHSAGHSRIPVYRETLDDPLYMVHIKDLMGLMMQRAHSSEDEKKQEKEEENPPPRDGTYLIDLSVSLQEACLGRSLLFVPASMSAADLLERMQATRIHLALVVDEYGGTDGMVSIEDLVEEIVGDIEDEHDDRENQNLISKPDLRGRYEVDGRVEIDLVEARLERKLILDSTSDEIDTLGGLIFAMLGRIPVRGEIVPHPTGVEFIIAEADPRRVRRVLIQETARTESSGGVNSTTSEA